VTRENGSPPSELPAEVEVAIVGAGFGGLGMAIQMKRAGMDDFVVLERADDVGGTWQANTYPGCQCDIPSNLYSFSFARNAGWPRAYPLQADILDYLRECARRFELLPHTHLRCELLEAKWDADEARWRIETSRGRLAARVLVAAPGLLSAPKLPPIPGIDLFEGTAFHTAAWNHEHDLTGKRVALVGTGATAVQVAPRIREQVRRMYVFQRTAGWVVPHVDRPIGPRRQRLYARLPLTQSLARAGIYGLRETFAAGMTRNPSLLKGMEAYARMHLRVQVHDAELRRRLTPDYAFGCKRMLLSSEWYPTITAPNVELISAGVDEVRPNSLVAGTAEREVDTIIFATGFAPSEPPLARHLRGTDGRTLAETWAGSPQAYLGTAVTGFPNLFLLYGPNVNLGHSSIVYMLESQVRYVMGALTTMRRGRVRTFEVRADVQETYNEELQERLARSVWNTGGCGSWYLDRNGRNSIMWGDYTFKFRRRTRTFEPAEYRLTWEPPATRLEDPADLALEHGDVLGGDAAGAL
jgi:cation diffusion facilitator CzcD-associated flavoprotein CzcO